MNRRLMDTLISRAVSDDGGARDWDDLVALAEADPALWREVAEGHHDDVVLRRAMSPAAHLADSTPLPASAPRRAAAPPWRGPARWISAGGGWLVAALVALAWTIHLGATDPRDGASSRARVLPIATAADAFQTYLDMGRQERLVVGEIPTRILVESRRAPAGEGYELLYIRQVLERTVVGDLYQFSGQDEQGGATLVRYEHRPRSPM